MTTQTKTNKKPIKFSTHSHQIPQKFCFFCFFLQFFALFLPFFFFFGVGILEKLALKNALIVAIFGIFCYFFTFFLQNFLILKNDLSLIYLQFIYFFIRGKSNHISRQIFLPIKVSQNLNFNIRSLK